MDRSGRVRAGKAAQQKKRRKALVWVQFGLVALTIFSMVATAVWQYTGQAQQPAQTVAASREPVPASVEKALGSVSASAFDSASAGDLAKPSKAAEKPSGKKPTLVYIGAEYCPFCAAERWALVIALSRFGKWDGLELTRSTTADAYPGTPTFTFVNARYSSPYLDVRTVELAGNEPVGGSFPALETPSPEDQALFQKLDADGSIPFLMVGNLYWIGSQYSPEALQGKSWDQIAQEIAQGKSPLAQEVLAAANQLSAAICQATGGKPADVCSSPAVKGIKLP